MRIGSLWIDAGKSGRLTQGGGLGVGAGLHKHDVIIQ